MSDLPPLPLRIRSARTADAPAIRMVATVTWTAAYKHLIAPENIAAVLRKYYSVEHVTQSISREDSAWFVAELMMPPNLGKIIGYAHCGPYTAGGRDDFALRSLYALPEYQRKGIGTALWAQVIAWGRELHKSRMFVGVLTQNLPARRFYEQSGATISHEEKLPIGSQILPETWYQLNLAEDNVDYL